MVRYDMVNENRMNYFGVPSSRFTGYISQITVFASSSPTPFPYRPPLPLRPLPPTPIATRSALSHPLHSRSVSRLPRPLPTPLPPPDLYRLLRSITAYPLPLLPITPPPLPPPPRPGEPVEESRGELGDAFVGGNVADAAESARPGLATEALVPRALRTTSPLRQIRPGHSTV